MAMRPYSSKERHARLAEMGVKDRTMHRPNKHHPQLPRRKKLHNRLIAKVRAGVERPFAVFKGPYRMRRLRFFDRAANRTQCVLAAFAYNLRRMIGALYPPQRRAA